MARDAADPTSGHDFGRDILPDDQWPILSLQRELPPAKFVSDRDGQSGLAVGYDAERDRQRFQVSDKGITLVVPEMLGQGLY